MCLSVETDIQVKTVGDVCGGEMYGMIQVPPGERLFLNRTILKLLCCYFALRRANCFTGSESSTELQFMHRLLPGFLCPWSKASILTCEVSPSDSMMQLTYKALGEHQVTILFPFRLGSKSEVLFPP
jgi:hypothetical protein